MMQITLNSTGVDPLLALLKRIEGTHRDKATQHLIGRDVSELIRDHLYKKDAQPSKHGGTSTHYYRGAGDSVHHELTATGTAVNVSQIGIRQRLEGGVITPKTAKALTIPISPRAHGKRAREFIDTFVIDLSDTGDPATVGMIVQETGPDSFDPLFILRTKVTQRADPTVIPDQRVIVSTASAAVMDFLNRIDRAAALRKS